jgi:hypothetical protein
MDHQEFDTNYYISVKDDRTTSEGHKCDFFFNKLLTVNGELKGLRVDYEKKRAEVIDLKK